MFIYQENVFSNNVAITKGGAYFYPKFRPSLISNTFTNNTAKYGPDIGSIPIKIFINDSISNEVILENIPSGQIVPFEMTISLKDWDDQIMNLDNESTIEIFPYDSTDLNLKVLG